LGCPQIGGVRTAHLSQIRVSALQSPAVKALATEVGRPSESMRGNSPRSSLGRTGISLRGKCDELRRASPTNITVQTQKPVGSRPSRDVNKGNPFPTSDQLRALLLGASPQEVLARIATDDRLQLRPAVVERLRQRCQLLDASQVHLRCLALCAREACRYQGTPSLSEWLSDRVDEAIQQILTEDPSAGADDGAWASLAAPLGLDPRDARLACGVFNQLPIDQRRAFYRLVIEREQPGHVSGDLGVELDDLLNSAKSAIEHLIRWHDSVEVEDT